MVLFWGSHGDSSTVMQLEEPVRQELQFYYVVSYNALHSELVSFLLHNSQILIVFIASLLALSRKAMVLVGPYSLISNLLLFNSA